MILTEGFRRVIVGFSWASMALGTLLLVVSLAVFVAKALGWISFSPSIAVIQSAGWMVIAGLVLSRVAKAPS